MEISVNEKKFTLPDNSTLETALTTAGIKTSGIATAINGDVVPADRRASTILNEGDSILVIQPFYGG